VKNFDNNSRVITEKRRIKKSWMYATSGIFVIYGLLLLFEALFLGTDMRHTLISIMAGVPIFGIILLIYYVFPRSRYMPLYISIFANIVFFAVGSYLQELSFYFFFFFLIVGTLSVLKDFRLMLLFLVVSVMINIAAVSIVFTQYDWVNSFRFFNQFAMSLFGAILMAIQTYNVASKEGQSERALAAFSAILRSTPDMLTITDKDRKVLYISDQMAEFFKCPRIEYAIGQPLVDLIAEKRMKTMFADMLDTDAFYTSVEEIDIDGKKRYFRIISDKFTGDAEGMYIDLSDITATVEAQMAAEDANKSKSNFLATMSHEIRTPMNAIIGFSDIELERDDHPPETREAFDRIRNSGKTLLGIINDILDLSKIETGKLELIPVKYETASLINDTVRLNSMRIGDKPVDLIIKVSEDLPSELYGDELRIKQILNNIMSNAIKYTDQGSVTFETDIEQDDKDTTLIFKIRDTGQGMTQEQLGTLFDEYSMFNTEANRSTEGTGLGMSITKSLVEMMDGKIMVESEPDSGTVFTVRLKQEWLNNVVIGKKLAENLQGFKFTSKMQRSQIVRELMPYGSVLIVDDLDENLIVAKGLMKPYGLSIETVTGGYEALEKVNSGNVYDIIFMDQMMPGMDGLETTKLIREAGYTHHIVALSANALAGQAEIFLENGFDDFISKPIDIRHLNDVLNKLIRDKHTSTPGSDKPPRHDTSTQNSNKPPSSDSTVSDNDTDWLAQIKKIEALNVEAALDAMSGLQDVYLDTVKLTKRLLPERIDKMDDFIDSDIKAFTVEVHGLKSVLKNIGATALGNNAAALERAGLDDDKQYCDEFYPPFRASLSDLEEHLKAALPEKNTEPFEAAETFSLQQALTGAKTASENFDRDNALELLAPHREFSYGEAADELLKETVFALEAFDCEKALEYIIKLEETIKNI